MTTIPRVSDRIRLIAMDDPVAIAPGETGTVHSVSSVGEGRDRWHQIDVSWDNGRALMLVSPPDRFEIVSA